MRIRNYYTSLHEFVTSVLDQIKQYTKVVADTGYFESTQKPNYAHHFTIYSTYLLYRSIDKKVELATDKLLINFDNEILKIIPGRVSTEVDAILSFDTEGTIAKANCLIGLYEEAGIVACAEAGVTLVSPFVDRILDWYKKNTGQDFSAKEDPGEGEELAGCDLLIISPKLLEQLHSDTKKTIKRNLSPENEKVTFDEKGFRWALNEDAMATEKLAEGIRDFAKLKTHLRELLSA
ncbi:1190_t:CDS:2 [Entrophospora sp. SA101]|nr:1190_t:CDS:2 [Entrophospora sp. SA101]CAJ0862989.1 3863_t:CDS:2 [Entrophospora sp. SA101]CAJ0868579.1 11409_t:CDS:2 [Entrophospora sp. SA101]